MTPQLKSRRRLQHSRLPWSEAERTAWQLPREISVSEWCNENIYLDPLISAEPGLFRTDRTPYLKEIMDSVKDVSIKTTVLMMSTQVGKTQCLLNMLGYAMDQDAGPAMWVVPREEDARMMAEDRIKPMIRLSPALVRQETGNTDDLNKKGMRLGKMKLYFGWANSPASLSSKPIRYLFFDEPDKYPKFSGREADPIKLGSERTRTFWNRKIFMSSTPTTKDGYINREYERTDRRRYFLPCPHCGRFQVLMFDQIKWQQEDLDPETIVEPTQAYYECIHCKARIEDYHKHRMLLAGRWVPEVCVDKAGEINWDFPKSSRRGYHLNAIYSPWLTFAEIAGEFLRSKDKPETLMNFVNSWLAQIWTETIEAAEEDKVASLAADYGEGEVPAPAQILTAAVDVQLDHFFYLIRAWGPGEESWLIRSGEAKTWTDLEDILFNTNYQQSGSTEQLDVRLAAIDTGYRTDEVYTFVGKWRHRARAVKGLDRSSGVPLSMKRIERYPNGKPIPGGLPLWSIEIGFFKDKLFRAIAQSLEEVDQKTWHIHREPEKKYLKQLCSEHKIPFRNKRTGAQRELWVVKPGYRANHFLDCEVYASAAARMLNVAALRKPGETVTYKPKRSGGMKWAGNHSGWMRRRP